MGYYIADNKINEEELQAYLQARLPEYMVPSVLVYLDKLPLTVNGKLDRKALPEPELSNIDHYTAPRNELERQVCQIWADVLGIPQNKIGIRDDFFRLGGDSIVSIQLVSRIRQRLELSVSVKDIFSYKTIERLYDNVLSKGLSSSQALSIRTEQGVLSGEAPPFPSRMVFERNFAEINYWNQSFLVRTPSLDLERLQESVTKLINHHDGFRLRY